MELTIREVEEITGVKAPVLRYWEQEIPMLQPKRDKTGRCIYSEWDIQILFRLKHLLYDLRYTITDAGCRLFLELSGGNQDTHVQIALVRAELLTLYHKVRSLS
ncbi:MAG: MerR family transcriptional regulator [Treponema sp.]|jgi:DNA-binding transcriptional MerR regulator|nr:MerR family transcriptional regulator [Treponema sp.]